MTRVSATEFDAVATLARLHFTPERREQLLQQLPAIVDFVDQLNEIDTQHVPPYELPHAEMLPLRPDQVTTDPIDHRNDLLAAMPDTDAQGHLVVQAVFTDELGDEAL